MKKHMGAVAMQIRSCVLALLLLIPGIVYAIEDVYLVLAAGPAGFEESGFEEATALKVGVGSERSKYFAYEISYLSLGTFDAEDSLLAEFGDEVGESFNSIEVAIDGMDISFYGMIPLNRRVSVLGRIGAYLWEGEIAFETAPRRQVAEDDGNDISFGLGLEYALSWRTTVTFMYDQYQAFDEDIEFLNAGIKITF